MTPTSKAEIKRILKKYNLRPSKGLGQNFLIDKTAVKKIVAAADLKSEDIVVEIGPGLGVLTLELAKKVKKVVAIEKDSGVYEILKNILSNLENIEVVKADIRKTVNCQLPTINYKLIANLPFYLTAPIIRKFLEAGVQPESMTLVIQKEVAQRICAKSPKMNLLAASVQFYADPKIISYISKKSFWPQPKVEAAIIKLKTKNEKRKVNKSLFFKIAKAGFSQPRKQLINNLSKELKIDKIKIESWLRKNNLQPTQRAEALNMESWINLTKSFKIQ